MVEEDVNVVKKFKVRDRVHPRLVTQVKYLPKHSPRRAFKKPIRGSTAPWNDPWSVGLSRIMP